MDISITPTFRVEVWENVNTSINFPSRSFYWCKEWGRANEKNLEKFMAGYNKSFQESGVNYLLSVNAGYIMYAHRSRIVRQVTGEVVATWNAPAFQEI